MGKQNERNHERQILKARSRGYLTVRGDGDQEAVEAWTAECASSGMPLIIVSPLPKGTAIAVVQGVRGESAREWLHLAAAAGDMADQAMDDFEISREENGTYLIGPLPLRRIQTFASSIVTAEKAHHSTEF